MVIYAVIQIFSFSFVAGSLKLTLTFRDFGNIRGEIGVFTVTFKNNTLKECPL